MTVILSELDCERTARHQYDVERWQASLAASQAQAAVAELNLVEAQKRQAAHSAKLQAEHGKFNGPINMETREVEVDKNIEVLKEDAAR